MFVRAKTQNGRTYHYLVATERQGGRVRHKTLAYLGEHPTIEAALTALPKNIEKVETEAHTCTQKADALRQKMLPVWIERNGGEVPRSKRRGCRNINKMFGDYWFYLERAQVCEQRARKMREQLRNLRAL